MITCAAARELLLEARPADLRGAGDGALAAHVRACPACRQRATFILAETEALRSTMAALRPPLQAVESRPGGEVRAVEREPKGKASGRLAANRRTGRHAIRWRLAVPLSLAAGIAVLLLVRRHDMTAPGGAPLQVASAAPPAFDVQVPAGQSVAVFQTANPNIVVIWSY